ncbi:hypothetical protein [Comamonas testosteroni]|uniref:hypothetical protein n=1 Tax=Comamonas testosteroni TaxID=285 RepID=UPI0005B44C0E|nr:hypothetical protein [Comamonas testosteroni]
MSNTAYPKGAEKILSGAINFAAATIKVALVSDAYTYSAAHEFLSSVTRVGTDQTLTGKSVTGGVFDAAAVEFGVLAPGSRVKAVVLYLDSGNPSTSPLLFFMDSVQGLPMDTNGGEVRVPWDTGPNKIAAVGLPFYPKGAQRLLNASLNLATDNLMVALLPSSYVYAAAHEFLSDVGATLGTAQALNGRTVTGGVFDADDLDFGNSVAAGTIGSAVIYKDTGLASASPLVMHIKDVSGFPLPASGGGLQLRWSDGAHKIVSLLGTA